MDHVTEFKVVVNGEGQYALWPAARDTPLGWQETGTAGAKQECLDYVRRTWQDMRPLSLRTHQSAMEGK